MSFPEVFVRTSLPLPPFFLLSFSLSLSLLSLLPPMVEELGTRLPVSAYDSPQREGERGGTERATTCTTAARTATLSTSAKGGKDAMAGTNDLLFFAEIARSPGRNSLDVTRKNESTST